MSRDEIIKARFNEESAPPPGTFKDIPIKDCMAIYAEYYAKRCLDLFISELLVTGNGKHNGSVRALIRNPYFILPDHD